MTEETQTPPAQQSNQPGTEEKIWATLAYISVLVVLPMFLKSKNEFCQFHASQGIGIFFLGFFILFLTLFLPFIGALLFLLFLLLSIFVIMKVWKGEKWKIPFVFEIGDALNIAKKLH